MTNRLIGRLAPCFIVLACAAFAAGVVTHNAGATGAALVSMLSGAFAWIGAS